MNAPGFTWRTTSVIRTTPDGSSFFPKCVAHLARYLPWRPDLVHVHDWQAAMVPALMLHQRRAEGWGNSPPTCLTIHNLAYQGNFPGKPHSR